MPAFHGRTAATEVLMQHLVHGQLRHHFWGDYSATIMLQFGTVALASLAQQSILPDWEPHPQEPRALRYHGTGADLKRTEALLVRLGADGKKLRSLARSIDFGEPFTITFDTTPAPTEVQLTLLEAR